MVRPGKLICFISLGLGLILSKMPMDAGNAIEGSSCYDTRLQVLLRSKDMMTNGLKDILTHV